MLKIKLTNLMLFSGGFWHCLWQIGEGDSQHRPSAVADLHLIFSSGSCEEMLNWYEHSLLYYSSHKVRSASALLNTSWSHRDITSSKLPLSAATSPSSVYTMYRVGDGVRLKYTSQLKFRPEKHWGHLCFKCCHDDLATQQNLSPVLFHLCWRSLCELWWAGKCCSFKQVDSFPAAPKEFVLSF